MCFSSTSRRAASTSAPRRRSTRILRDLADQGVGIVAISSELPELIGISDRILVLHQGRIAGEVEGDDMNEETIMQLASGLAGHVQIRREPWRSP